MLNTTRNEFKKSFNAHFNLYVESEGTSSLNTRRLMIFYCVECGLKNLLLKQIGKNTYEDLQQYKDSIHKDVAGHNLKELTKEIGIESAYPLKSIKLKKGSVQPRQYNELWRYGVTVENEEDAQREEKTLYDIALWIKQRI